MTFDEEFGNDNVDYNDEIEDVFCLHNDSYLFCILTENEMVVCGDSRLLAGRQGKPPPKSRKYAGFGTMGIRESIVLHKAWLF